MNDLNRTDHRARVEDLVGSLNGAERNTRSRPREFDQFFLDSVNKLLSTCRIFPQIRAPGKRKRVVFWSAVAGVSNEKELAYRTAVPKILSLYERGLLSSLRQCDYAPCLVWFHAANRKRKFHSDRCRNRAHYAHLSPKSKAQRRAEGRKYMKKYRARERAKDLKAKVTILEAQGKTQEAAVLKTKALKLKTFAAKKG